MNVSVNGCLSPYVALWWNVELSRVFPAFQIVGIGILVQIYIYLYNNKNVFCWIWSRFEMDAWYTVLLTGCLKSVAVALNVEDHAAAFVTAQVLLIAQLINDNS